MRIIKQCIAALLIFSANIIFAQGHIGAGMLQGVRSKTGVVKGVIKSEQAKLIVKYANAALLSAKDSSLVSGAVADENGVFVMKDIPYGNYFLLIDFIGFYKKTIPNVKLYPKQKVYDAGVVFLKEASENIDEVVVNAERNIVEYKIDRKIINISKNINAAGGTVVDALENAPSIQVDINGNVSMRGSSNFRVLIDGKPSLLEANDALKQIPASAVENVEIITNPSVKFDPDGTTGIINIIMKKSHKSGFSGIVNASIGLRDKYSADFLFNYKAKKTGVYFGADFGNYWNYGTATSLRETFLNDTTDYLESNSDNTRFRKNYSVKGGIDFYLNEKNTLSFSGKYGFFGFGFGHTDKRHHYSAPTLQDAYMINGSNFEIEGNRYSGAFDYKHNFVQKGHEINFSAEYSLSTGGNENRIRQSESDKNFSLSLNDKAYKTFQDRARNRYVFKLDYSYPFNEKSKVEAGLQSRILDASGNYSYADSINGHFVENDVFSNEMTFKRNIYSAYATYSGVIAGFAYMAGLRGEYTDRLIHQITTGKEYPVLRPDFFPSLHISKEIRKTDQVQVSYSRRVNRPRHWYMNPFPGFSDEFSVRQGNPALLPEYVDSYELSYNKRINTSYLNFAVYYRQTNNAFQRIKTLLDDGKILHTFMNTDKEFAAGSELSGNFRFFKWWMLYANINAYYFKIETDGITAGKNSFNYDARLNSTFLLGKNSRLQLSWFYNSPTVTSQGRREAFNFGSVSFKQEFFKKKLSVVLRVKDVLRTGKYVSLSEEQNFSLYSERRSESPVFMLSLSYKINNYKQKRSNRGDVNDPDEDDGMM